MDQEVEQILNLVHIHEDPSEIFELLDPLGTEKSKKIER